MLSSVPLGFSTALAVAAHQVPQEVGDFAVLLGSGYSRRRALTMNILAATTGILGAIIIYGAAGWVPRALPYILAFAAGNFMYVAMADLIPGPPPGHGRRGGRSASALDCRRHRHRDCAVTIHEDIVRPHRLAYSRFL